MRNPLRRSLALAAVGAFAGAAVLGGLQVTNSTSASASPQSSDTSSRVVQAVEAEHTGSTKKPTVVLVHGAFADSSGWNGVIERLRRDDYPVIAFANPLQGLTSDVATLKSFLSTIDGPLILAGHSYGGAVISGAAAGDPDVKGLVYVAAFAPDKGETIGELSSRPVANPNPPLPLVSVPFTAPDGHADALSYIEPAKFPEFFAADVKSKLAKDMAATQRPVAGGGFTDVPEAAAWRTIPSWYLVAKQDKAINPDTERYMARRANAHTVEVNGSHAVMVSRPGAVSDLIEAADRGTR